MEQEWSEIDGEVLSVLERLGEASPETIARQLGIPVGEVTAFICMLAREGNLRIQLVESIGSARPASRRAARLIARSNPLAGEESAPSP